MSRYLDYRDTLSGDTIIIGNPNTVALNNEGDVILDISSGLLYLQYIEQGSIEWRQWLGSVADGNGSYILVYSFPVGDYFAIHNSQEPSKDFIQYFKNGIEVLSASYDRPQDGSLVRFDFSTTTNGINVNGSNIELNYSVGNSETGINFSDIRGKYSSLCIDCKLTGIMRNVKFKKGSKDLLSYPLTSVLSYVDESVQKAFGDFVGNPTFVYGDYR